MKTTIYYVVPGTCDIQSPGGLSLSKAGNLKAISAARALHCISLNSIYSCSLPCCVETTHEILKQQQDQSIKLSFLPDLIDTRREDWGVIERRVIILLNEFKKNKGQNMLVVASQRIIESFVGRHFNMSGKNISHIFPIQAGVPICQEFFTPY